MTFRRCVWVFAVVCGLVGSRCGKAGVSYQDPAGGWQYTYQGTFNAPVVDAGCTGGTCPAGFGNSNQTGALDGTWNHSQSSKWDGSAPGDFSVPNNNPTGTSPGGAAALTEGGANFIRLQDTGNPELFGYIQAGMKPTNSNRRVYFGHDMTQDVDLSTPGAQKVLDNGITISFRMRIPNSGTLDQVYTSDPGSGTPINQNWFVSPEGDYNNDGYVNAADYVLWRKNFGTNFQLSNEVAGTTPGMVTQEDYTEWRARFGTGPIGRGYPIHDDGRGMITVLQNNNTADPFDPFNGIDGTIAFSMVTSKDIENFCSANPSGTLCSGSGSGGLMMNNQSGNAPNNSVDSYDTGQTLNLLEIPDAQLSNWHEFWITIQDKTAAGNGALPGTHTVKVYMDGATTPTSFQVTMSGSGNGAYSKVDIAPFLEFGLSSTDQFGSFDMDFLSYHLGVVAPVAVGAGLGSSAIPEPSALVLILMAISGLQVLRLSRNSAR
jgi:hypothetical protein